MLKKLLIISIFSFSLYAEGMGIYMLNVVDEYSYGENEPDYGYSPGVGISFDTNLGKNKVFAYRLNFEYYRATGTDFYFPSDTVFENYKVKYDVKKSVFSVVNIFSFGIYRSKYMRLWIGPVLSIHSEKSDERNDYDDYYYEMYPDINLDAGPIVGINLNINDNASLAIDVSYGLLSTGTESPKVRAYLFWRFGETFEKRRPKVQPIQQRPQPKVQEKKSETFEEKLKYLKSLRDQEILTEEEYQFKRKELVQSLKL